jgi:hypothetical protein
VTTWLRLLWPNDDVASRRSLRKFTSAEHMVPVRQHLEGSAGGRWHAMRVQQCKHELTS